MRATDLKNRIFRKNSRLGRKLKLGLKLTGLILLFLSIIMIPSSAKSAGIKVISSGKVHMTAYNSLPNQTDSTPWITASGSRCREGVIAANFLPIGTKVMIEGFGDQVFTVEDRMNKRYYKRIDIWFREYDDAIKFGVRKLKYYVLES